MDKQRIDEIRERCDAATKGPWELTKDGRYEDHDECRINLPNDTIELCSYENGEFIAHARTDVPDLLDEVERLTAEMAAMTADRDAAQREIDGLTAAYDLKMRVHDALNRDYVALREVHTTLNGIMCGIRDERDAWKARCEAAEMDFARMLCIMPVAVCKKFCKNASPHCAGWCECDPVWRGPVEGGEGKP